MNTTVYEASYVRMMWYKCDVDNSQLIVTCYFVGPANLLAVMLCLEKRGLVARWRRIGVQLQLLYSDLEIIANNNSGEENRMMAMLNQWLTSGKATKQALVDALQRIR